MASCNCTWCARTGGLWGYYAPEEACVRAARTAVYAPDVLNEHHCCAACSGMMFNHGLKWTPENASGGVPEERQFGVNMRMIDEEAVRALPVTELDGRHGW